MVPDRCTMGVSVGLFLVANVADPKDQCNDRDDHVNPGPNPAPNSTVPGGQAVRVVHHDAYNDGGQQHTDGGHG